jgi:hypothetical protein
MGQNYLFWSEEDEWGEVGEEGHRVTRVLSGIDQSFQSDLLKRSVNTGAKSPGE